MRFLSVAEYDSVLRAALQAQGLSLADAERLIQSRWPMESDSLASEAFGRGLHLDHDAWSIYVRESMPDVPADGDFVAIVNSQAADRFFRWACDTGNARLTLLGEQLQRDCTDRVIRNTCRRAAAANN